MNVSSIRRRLAALGVMSMVVLIGFVAQSVLTVRSEARMQDQLIASRVFDELERALTDVLEEEEERPFLHFTSRYNVANDAGWDVTAVSPLAERIPAGFRVGWFQRTDDGFSTPLSEHQRLPSDALRSIQASLEEALSTAEETEPAVTLKRTPSRALLGKLNQASRQRSQTAQNTMVQPQQVANFLAPTKLDGTSTGGRPTNAPTRGTEVTVEPYRVVRNGAYWVWERRVTTSLGERSQGLVVRRTALLEHLEERVLGEVAEVTLTWDPDEPQYRFEPPFQDLSASVQVESGSLWSAEAAGTTGLGLFGLLAATAWLGRQWLASAEERARERTDFVASVTHELRTPLTSIRLYTEMLESGMAPPDQQSAYLATIRSEAERLSQLVESVLTFSRLERRGEATQSRRPLGEVVGDMRAALEPMFEREAVELSIDLGDAKDVEVPRESVLQILHNLVDNGRKFSAGRPVRNVIVSATAQPLTLRVSDTGPGIEPEVFERMFEPFARGSGVTAPGSGIGLAVVAGLVAELGGELEQMPSEEGLSIEVRLPKREVR